MIPGQRVQQSRSLAVQVWIRIGAKGCGLRAGDSRFQQSDVADARRTAQDPFGDVELLRQGQVDLWASRSSASA